MSLISLDYLGVTGYLGSEGLASLEKTVSVIHAQMYNEQGFYPDFDRWIDHMGNFDRQEFDGIQRTATRIRKTSDVLLVIGMDGSSLGVRAVIDMFTHPVGFHVPGKERNETQILFVPEELSNIYMRQIRDGLVGKDFSIFVVSESGIVDKKLPAYRFFHQMLEHNYGKTEAEERVHTTAYVENGYSQSRKSNSRHLLFSSAGLLSMAVAGVDIGLLTKGAKLAHDELVNSSLSENSAYQYAAVRHLLSREGMAVEWLVVSDYRLFGFGEWRRWLYGNDAGGMDVEEVCFRWLLRVGRNMRRWWNTWRMVLVM